MFEDGGHGKEPARPPRMPVGGYVPGTPISRKFAGANRRGVARCWVKRARLGSGRGPVGRIGWDRGESDGEVEREPERWFVVELG